MKRNVDGDWCLNSRCNDERWQGQKGIQEHDIVDHFLHCGLVEIFLYGTFSFVIIRQRDIVESSSFVDFLEKNALIMLIFDLMYTEFTRGNTQFIPSIGKDNMIIFSWQKTILSQKNV